MNYRLILRMLGRTLVLECAFVLIALFVSLYFGEDPMPFAYSALIIGTAGLSLSFLPCKREFFAQEGFVVAGAIWLLFCLFGALPFYFSGYFSGYVDCLFEIASGFTTTGATILQDVEILPRGILFWRSFSSWLGGMGVLILTLAFLPALGARTHNLLRAEATGPVVSKLVPKTAQSSKILYGIYVSLTALEIVCLKLAGMPLFDAVLHSFSTICTGGMSIKNASIGAYNSGAIELIIAIFILLSSINFAVYFLVITKRLGEVLRSDELRYFLLIVLGAGALITANLLLSTPISPLSAVRTSFFQAVSVISTTGFFTADFNLWPEFSRMILIALMVIGGSAGSTAGGLKVSRFLLLVRCIRRDIGQLSHPRLVKVVKLDGKAVDEGALRTVSTFFGCYVLVLGLTCLVVSLDGFSFATTFTAVLASISNVGPGFDMVGPLENFSAFSDLSKLSLAFCMLLGRLEIFPILILFSRSTWGRS